MFDIEKTAGIIENAILSYYKEARERIKKELASEGYKGIIKNVEIEGPMQINITFEKDIDAEGQDFFNLLAEGGVIKKKNEYLQIMPSFVIKKYLGRR